MAIFYIKKLIILADDLLSKAKLAEIKSFSLKTKTPILQMDEITEFKKYITSYSGSDNQNFIYYFLNNNNKKINKSFKNLMLDCFIKVFKKVEKLNEKNKKTILLQEN